MRSTTRITRTALFLALAGALASAAQAADVQLYGRVETALFFQKVESEDNAKLQMENGASRIGLTINEALTDDLSMRGYLETGFGSDDGTLSNTSGGAPTGSTMLFDRRAILAVKSKTWGELGFGRMGTVRSTMAPYGWGLGSLDPFETAYSVDCSISGMFGNDARGNNSITWMSPKAAGFQGGITYSLATTGQEADETGKNNRQLALMLSYTNGPLMIVTGATEQRFGYDENPSATDPDKGKKYDRENARAYTLGATYQLTDSVKLFAAYQYHDDWRMVGGWNVDRWYGSAARHGIDGSTYLLGAQFWPTASIRLIGDVIYFDGSHKTEDEKITAERTVVNGAFEYYFSKTAKAYVALSYSTGSGALDSDRTFAHFGSSANDVNRWTGHIGLQKRF